jgi:hypothetical protein
VVKLFDTPIDFSNPNSAEVFRAMQQLQSQAAPLQPPQFPSEASVSSPLERPSTAPLLWPPGNVGGLALLMYQLSIRPVAEVSIATALATVAGVCGLGWNTHTGAGLNLYIAFVGRSGIGKEAIADGISKLMTATFLKGAIHAPSFFTFDSLASGQALVKQMAETPCLLHISGEFGHDISYMAIDKTGPHATLRQQMTKLYTKSSAGSVAGGISYSNRESNVQIGGSVSYSIVGETTPGTFYEALNGSMMSDGFLSRFVVIEYEGQRPPENEHRGAVNKAWTDWFEKLVNAATSQTVVVPAIPDEDAKQLYANFNLECDMQVNATQDEARRQMWNRAHLKALKVGALLAVADNHVSPTVTGAQAKWAIELVQRDIGGMTKRLMSGDIGGGDDTRRQKVQKCVREWLTEELSETYRKRNGWPEMKQASLVPRNYLTNRLQSLPLFANHRLGANAAMSAVLDGMVRDGLLRPIEKGRIRDMYGFSGEAYAVLWLD